MKKLSIIFTAAIVFLIASCKKDDVRCDTCPNNNYTNNNGQPNHGGNNGGCDTITLTNIINNNHVDSFNITVGTNIYHYTVTTFRADTLIQVMNCHGTILSSSTLPGHSTVTRDSTLIGNNGNPTGGGTDAIISGAITPAPALVTLDTTGNTLYYMLNAYTTGSLPITGLNPIEIRVTGINYSTGLYKYSPTGRSYHGVYGVYADINTSGVVNSVTFAIAYTLDSYAILTF